MTAQYILDKRGAHIFGHVYHFAFNSFGMPIYPKKLKTKKRAKRAKK